MRSSRTTQVLSGKRNSASLYCMALVFGHETGVLLDARNKPAPAPNNVPLTSHRRQRRGSLVDPYSVALASATQSWNFAVRTRRLFRRHYALAPHRPAL